MRLMKKAMLLAAIVACTGVVQAQDNSDRNLGVFKHLGADLSVGTEGIGIDVATPVTNYLELGFGVNFMPGIKISGDVDVDDIVFSYTNPTTGATTPVTIPMNDVNIEGKLARTTMNFKASIYPFGQHNDFFVVAGFSFGGKKIAKLTGHSDDVKAFMDDPSYPDEAKRRVFASIDKYEVKFDSNGDINGDVRVKSFRPYLGLGYGRQVPKHHRLGCRIELGCQFMGKMKIYQNNTKVDINELGEKGDDDLSDFIDKLKVYPVLKLSLTGRIL